MINQVNKNVLIETIQLLLYKEEVSILENLDIEDDTVFLEPLLFAYFNSKKEGLYSNSLLTEIMQGYFVETGHLLLNESYNDEGIAYVPNLGYFDKLGNKNDDILKIDVFEIVKVNHPLIEKYFIESYKGHIINIAPKHNCVWKDNYKELEKSILIIKEHLPEFYNDLVFANKRVYLHDNPKILNFTTIETLGMLYFYVVDSQNLIYFIEELIHQGSHNFLYYVLHNKKDYFKIDVDKIIMRELTHQDWDYRNVYGAFHGVYTVFKRVECFDILLSKNVFKGEHKHELLGRLTDQFSRFRTGLELLNLDEVYTEKGKQFYLEIDSKCAKLMEKYSFLKSIFDLSNRDLDFNYKEFCLLNPIEKFYSLESEGKFNFF